MLETSEEALGDAELDMVMNEEASSVLLLESELAVSLCEAESKRLDDPDAELLSGIVADTASDVELLSKAVDDGARSLLEVEEPASSLLILEEVAEAISLDVAEPESSELLDMVAETASLVESD